VVAGAYRLGGALSVGAALGVIDVRVHETRDLIPTFGGTDLSPVQVGVLRIVRPEVKVRHEHEFKSIPSEAPEAKPAGFDRPAAAEAFVTEAGMEPETLHG
jgi:hypothetical protein